jgi:hypothetical protein
VGEWKRGNGGTYAVQGVCPGGLKDWSRADWVVIDGLAKHGVFLVIWDRHSSASNCNLLAEFTVYIGRKYLRGISMSQFFRISILLSSVVMLGTNLSMSGVRSMYLCDATPVSSDFLYQFW